MKQRLKYRTVNRERRREGELLCYFDNRWRGRDVAFMTMAGGVFKRSDSS